MSLSVLLHCPGSKRPWAREREAAGEQAGGQAGQTAGKPGDVNCPLQPVAEEVYGE